MGYLVKFTSLVGTHCEYATFDTLIDAVSVTSAPTMRNGNCTHIWVEKDNKKVWDSSDHLDYGEKYFNESIKRKC